MKAHCVVYKTLTVTVAIFTVFCQLLVILPNADAQGVDVHVTVRPSDSSFPTNLTLTCQYHLTDLGYTLRTLEWIYGSNGDNKLMYDHPNGPSDEYKHRIIDGHIDDDMHVMTLNKTTQCDFDRFTCQIYWNTGSGVGGPQNDFDNITVSHEEAGLHIEGGMQIDKDEDNYILSDVGNVTVWCNATRNKNFSISLNMEDGIEDTGYGEQDGDLPCMHSAQALLEIEFKRPGESRTFHCIVNYDGEDEHRVSATVMVFSREENGGGGLSDGEIAGIVIGSVAGVALVASLVIYLYRSNTSKGINKTDEEKVNGKKTKGNQVGDSKEDVGNDETRNQNNTNCHDNPTYSSR